MTQFSIKKTEKKMVLKHFIFPEMHFKANLFFSHYDPPQPKRGEWGLKKVKNKLTLKFILGNLKHF